MHLLLLTALAGANAIAAEDLRQFNTESPEYGLTQGPDGVYLTRMTGPWGESAGEEIHLYRDGKQRRPDWSDPDASESDFYFHAASGVGYFVSDRDGNADIWRVRWRDKGWSAPERLPAPVNSESPEYSPVIAPGGRLCFASSRPGGAGQGDIYCAGENRDNEWTVEPIAEINTAFGEWNLDFSPDGEALVFEASGRNTNISRSGDLYISMRSKAKWGPAAPLSKLNSQGSDLMPRFNDDGSLIYTSSNGEDADLHYASAEDLLTLKPSLVAVARSSGHIVLLDPATLAEETRIYVGQGPHDIASSEDGRIAISPLHGVYPEPHGQPVAPDQLRWRSEKSKGFALVDLVTGEVKTHLLENCPRPHGAAIAAQGERAWITCETIGEIREIDPRSGETLRAFKTEKGVHKIMLLAAGNLLAASSPEAGEAYLIDLVSGTVSSFKTGNGAEGIAASSDGRTFWIANSFDKTVCAIDAAERQQKACHATGGSFPIALAVDEDASKLWILRNASSDLVSISLSSGDFIDEIMLPSKPLGMAFDARSRRIFVTLPRRNEVIVINADTEEIEERTPGVMEGDDLDLVPNAVFEGAPDT